MTKLFLFILIFSVLQQDRTTMEYELSKTFYALYKISDMSTLQATSLLTNLDQNSPHMSSAYIIPQNCTSDKFLTCIILHLSIFYYLNRELYAKIILFTTVK
jgi:hypothetical protein